jgi:hypothetical protein
MVLWVVLYHMQQRQTREGAPACSCHPCVLGAITLASMPVLLNSIASALARNVTRLSSPHTYFEHDGCSLRRPCGRQS